MEFNTLYYDVQANFFVIGSGLRHADIGLHQ